MKKLIVSLLLCTSLISTPVYAKGLLSGLFEGIFSFVTGAISGLIKGIVRSIATHDDDKEKEEHIPPENMLNTAPNDQYSQNYQNKEEHIPPENMQNTAPNDQYSQNYQNLAVSLISKTMEDDGYYKVSLRIDNPTFQQITLNQLQTNIQLIDKQYHAINPVNLNQDMLSIPAHSFITQDFYFPAHQIIATPSTLFFYEWIIPQ